MLRSAVGSLSMAVPAVNCESKIIQLGCENWQENVSYWNLSVYWHTVGSMTLDHIYQYVISVSLFLMSAQCGNYQGVQPQ